jgi:DNA-binding LacI/PurR family transcriptional regulator
VPAPLEGDWSPRAGYELGRRLLETPDVTAVFVANDQMALGLLRRLHEAGVEIPQAISVVGFDDVPEASYFTPPLTTVRQDFAEIGRLSFQLLLGEVGGGTRSSRHETVPSTLVVRESTGPPPRR